MAVFRNDTFTKKKLVLDGNEFYDCIFNECHLTYRGGTLEFKAKAIRCHWVFEGAAQNTIALLRYLGFLHPSAELKIWPMDS